MSITSKIDETQNFGKIKARGRISPIELAEIIDSVYENRLINNVLWDFRYTDSKALNISNEFETITSELIQEYLNLKKACKTAIVAHGDLWLSFAKIFMKLSKIDKKSHRVQIFRFMDDALIWLGSQG
jgi:hypothetical protein